MEATGLPVDGEGDWEAKEADDGVSVPSAGGESSRERLAMFSVLW